MWNVRFIGVYGYVTRARNYIGLKWSVAVACSPCPDNRSFVSPPSQATGRSRSNVLSLPLTRERARATEIREGRSRGHSRSISGSLFRFGFSPLSNRLDSYILFVSSLFLRRIRLVSILFGNIRSRDAILSSSSLDGTKYTRRGRGKHTRANEKIKCAIIEAQFLFAPLSSTERRNTIAKYKQTRTVYTPRLIKFPFRLRVFSLASRFFLYFSLISLGPLFFKKGIISNGGVMAAPILGIVDSIQGVSSLSSDSFRTDGKKNSIFE